MKNQCTKCFRSLGVESRAKLFKFIEHNKESNVTQLTKHLGLKQPTISYHLKEMSESGLISKRISGKEVFYSISSKCPHDGESCIVSN